VRRLLLAVGLGVAGLLALAFYSSELKAGEKAKGECGTYGTTIEFRKSPQSAAARALKEEKLVFVLHVSGNFEDPTFT
jgi:hypothetical protein